MDFITWKKFYNNIYKVIYWKLLAYRNLLKINKKKVLNRYQLFKAKI